MSTVKIVLIGACLAALGGGIFLMSFGYRVNAARGSKRYRPGNRWINAGLVVVVAGGMALMVTLFSAL